MGDEGSIENAVAHRDDEGREGDDYCQALSQYEDGGDGRKQGFDRVYDRCNRTAYPIDAGEKQKASQTGADHAGQHKKQDRPTGKVTEGNKKEDDQGADKRETHADDAACEGPAAFQTNAGEDHRGAV